MTITYEYRHLGKPNPVHRATEPATAPIGQETPEVAAPTPTPWELIEATEHHGAYIVNSWGRTICDLYAMSNPMAASVRNGGTSFPVHFDDMAANAAFIVKAVNSHHTLWDRIRKVEHDNNQAAATISALREEVKAAYEQIKKLEAALDECIDYFEDRADADCDQDGYIPNEELSILGRIKETLHGPGAF